MNHSSIQERITRALETLATNNPVLLTEAAETIGTNEGPEASAARNLLHGWASYCAGRRSESLDLLGQAFDQYSALGDTIRTADVLRNIAIVHEAAGEFTEALAYYQRSLKYHEQAEDQRGSAYLTASIGYLHVALDEISKAVELLTSARAVFDQLNDLRGKAMVVDHLGKVYLTTGDVPLAIEHLHTALALHTDLADHNQVGITHGNLGVAYAKVGEFAQALEYLNHALRSREALGDLKGMAAFLATIGSILTNTANYPLALEKLHKSLEIEEQLDNRYAMSKVLISIGTVHYHAQSYAVSQQYLLQALTLAEEHGHRSVMADILILLGNVSADLGDLSTSLDHYRKALALFSDLGHTQAQALSLANIITLLLMREEYNEARDLLAALDAKEISDPDVRISRHLSHASLAEHGGDLPAAQECMEAALGIAERYENPSRQAEIHKLLRDVALQQNDFPAYVLHNDHFTRISEEIIGKETTSSLATQEADRRNAAERQQAAKHLAVLHSTLPMHIADRVARGEIVNDSYDNAVVLFLDIAGFTTYSSDLDASSVVDLLQDIFTSFDAICAEHNVMKIKTIGDSYMAVAFPSDRHLTDAASVAIAMQSQSFAWPGSGDRVVFRVGMHIGPVVAGVIGTQRLQYDVWGDTVNVASRMESTGEPGRIHVSDAYAEVLRSDADSAPFTLTQRGIVEIKGKGAMQTWWLESTTS